MTEVRVCLLNGFLTVVGRKSAIVLIMQIENDHYGLDKIMKRNTWKGSHDSSITLNTGRSTEVTHCLVEISAVFAKSSFVDWDWSIEENWFGIAIEQLYYRLVLPSQTKHQIKHRGHEEIAFDVFVPCCYFSKWWISR